MLNQFAMVGLAFLVVLFAVLVIIPLLRLLFLRRPAPPKNTPTLWEAVELFGQLTDEDQEAELAILRERVKAKRRKSNGH